MPAQGRERRATMSKALRGPTCGLARRRVHHAARRFSSLLRKGGYPRTRGVRSSTFRGRDFRKESNISIARAAEARTGRGNRGDAEAAGVGVHSTELSDERGFHASREDARSAVVDGTTLPSPLGIRTSAGGQLIPPSRPRTQARCSHTRGVSMPRVIRPTGHRGTRSSEVRIGGR
jgi:hypothetical protein